MDRSDWETQIYYDRDAAERAVDRLHEMGYEPDDISVVMRDRSDAERFATKSGTKAAEGAATGGVIGGILGALVAGFMATGAVVAIAGTGGAAAPLVVGPLAAALAGLGAGGAVGGIIGALVGLGIPEHKAREYEEGLNRGGLLIAVQPRPEDRDRVARVFESGDEIDDAGEVDVLDAVGEVPTTSETYDTGVRRGVIPNDRF